MRGVKVVIGERMRLEKAENKLELVKDPLEVNDLTKKIEQLRYEKQRGGGGREGEGKGEGKRKGESRCLYFVLFLL